MHGTKLLVRMAISLSRGGLDILHATTSQRCIRSPCLRQRLLAVAAASVKEVVQVERHFLGRYLKSSSNVNRGKDSHGGSITAVTQAMAR